MMGGSAVPAVVLLLVTCCTAACGAGHHDPDADGDADVDADSDGDGDGDGDVDCTRGRFEGSYTISDAASLEALIGYTEVGGFLSIVGTDLVTLDGLECLVRAGGLEIEGNVALTNVDGLAGLGYEFLMVWGNPALPNLDGLGGATYVSISDNAALTNVDFLRGLPSATYVAITGNAALTNVDGLADLATVDGCLLIGGNTVLADLDGLSRLASVGRRLDAVENVCVPGSTGLVLNGNPALTSLRGLSGLTFSRALSVSDDDALTNLDGLGGITSLEDLDISENAALTNVDGLSALTTVNRPPRPGWPPGSGDLSIRANGALTNLDGLRGLTELGGDVRVVSNTVLPTCEATALEDRLVSLGWDGQGDISGNDDAGVCE